VLFGLIKPRPTFAAARLQCEGSEGADIRAFQRRFNRRAKRYQIEVPVSGVYDDLTRRAVRLYQRRALNIRSADGFIGPQTARKLGITLLGPDGSR
jgi:peptidoglycan hydrolase-like protein with peptidoglycan-binding domain